MKPVTKTVKKLNLCSSWWGRAASKAPDTVASYGRHKEIHTD